MLHVKGKWALVTGANRGIGYRIAKFMAGQGCNLILHSRSLEHTKAVLEEVRALGVEAYDIAAELSDLSQVQKMMDEIDARGKPVDILFNDAAVQIAYRTDYWKTPAEDYSTSFVINTIAPMMLCYHFIPKMIERGWGRVINTTSGIRNEPEQAGYSASKAALDKVTSDLAGKLDVPHRLRRTKCTKRPRQRNPRHCRWRLYRRQKEWKESWRSGFCRYDTGRST